MIAGVLQPVFPAHPANVIGAGAAAARRALAEAAVASCVLGDDCNDDCGEDARWYAFVFRDRASHPALAAPEVTIAEVGEGHRPPDTDGQVVGLVAADLLDRWWDGRDVPPIRAGRFLATHAVGALLGAIVRVAQPTTGQRLSNETRVRALVCETLDAWQAGTLVAADGGSREPDDVVVLGPAERLRLATARTLIESRYAEKLTIDAIARTCGMGRARLIRGFRQLYGRTVADVLAERRLSQAAAALRATDTPVSQIAHASGYCSNAAFTRAFARHYGASPSLFRAGA